jgi:hypothetical protein
VTRHSDAGPGGAVWPGCPGGRTQGSMIRRCIIWRNKHTADIRLRTLVTRVNVA